VRHFYSGACECKLPRRPETMIGNHFNETNEICGSCSKKFTITEEKVSFGHDISQITEEIRCKILERTGLTASAGMPLISFIGFGECGFKN